MLSCCLWGRSNRCRWDCCLRWEEYHMWTKLPAHSSQDTACGTSVQAILPSEGEPQIMLLGHVPKPRSDGTSPISCRASEEQIKSSCPEREETSHQHEVVGIPKLCLYVFLLLPTVCLYTGVSFPAVLLCR